MLMKTIAFVRSNIPRALKNGKSKISRLNSTILSKFIQLLKTQIKIFTRKTIYTQISMKLVNFLYSHKDSQVDFEAIKIKGSIIDALILNNSIQSDDEDDDETNEFQELKTNINQINSNGVDSNDMLCPSFTNYLYFLFHDMYLLSLSYEWIRDGDFSIVLTYILLTILMESTSNLSTLT